MLWQLSPRNVPGCRPLVRHRLFVDRREILRPEIALVLERESELRPAGFDVCATGCESPHGIGALNNISGGVHGGRTCALLYSMNGWCALAALVAETLCAAPDNEVFTEVGRIAAHLKPLAG